MPRLRIALLGPFEVWIDGTPATGFTYTKVRALLAFLALEAERPCARAYLAALLWPDVPERRARQSLSQALTTLRDILGDRGPATAYEPFLLVTSESIQINPLFDYIVDVKCFVALLALAEAHQHHGIHICATCLERLRQAVTLYRGGLLAELPTIDSEIFDEWAQALRERLSLQALGALERLTRAAEWQKHYPEAIDYARRQTELAPRSEASHRDLVRLLALAGRPSEALAQSEQVHGMVAHERGICSRLRGGMGRMLTIVGPAGAGKTCLARAVARALRFEFADGVYWVELVSLVDPMQLLPAIAQALALPTPAAPSSIQPLAAHLRPRHLLLILDGFERVMGTAPTVAALLAACPELSILVTSRAPLRVRAESRYYLSSSVEIIKE